MNLNKCNCVLLKGGFKKYVDFLYPFIIYYCKPGVGKLRKVVLKGKSAAREPVNFLNGMRPAKESFAY